MAERLDALTVRESNGKSYWTKLGAAFPNKNGPGYMLKLDAIPAAVDGQYTIHLREPRPRDDRQDARSGGGQPRQQAAAFDDDSDGIPFASNDPALEWRVR